MEILITIFVTWFLTYNLFYSPRAQIRRLLKQMFNIPIKLARAKKKLGDENKYLYDTCKKALEVRHKTVIALLNFYFDPKVDCFVYTTIVDKLDRVMGINSVSARADILFP